MIPEFTWALLYDQQFTGFAGNPATVVEITNGQTDSIQHAVREIQRRKLENIKFWHCTDEESETFAQNFKDGECSFVFIAGVPSYERTMAHLKAWYQRTHFNSAIAGYGGRIAPVMQADSEFFAAPKFPHRVWESCWVTNHCHRETRP